MGAIKKLIKKYFATFVWFYSYLGNKIFIAFFLSIAVSVLDGLGLTMFFPLLQVVGNGGAVNAEEMGQLGVVIEALESIGITLTVLTVLITMIVFFILKGIANYGQRVYQTVLQQSFVREIRLNLLALLNSMAFKSFVTSDVGRIQNTMTGEVQKVNLAFITYLAAFQQGMMVLVYISFAFFADPQFAILVSIGGVLTNFLYRVIYTRTKTASRALTRHDSIFQGEVIQHIAHFKYLKATGYVHDYGSRLKKSIYQIEGHRKKIGVYNAIALAVREPMLVVIIAMVIFIQIHYLDGAMGAIIISLLFFYRGLNALMGLQESWNVFMANAGALENVQDFQKELSAANEKDGEVLYSGFKKGIKVQDADFYYGEHQILKDINLVIPKNTSVAFVGESGSGKTTLVSMLAGLLTASEGSVYVDDLKISDIQKHSYQKKIGFVSQDAVIFNDTIFNNVTFWAAPSEENLQRFHRALEQAAIADFVMGLPEGKETELGNNGINLSGGQKQRISIARELYKEIDLLILDEATSALDSETEKEIQTSIDTLQGHYTILIIAHRLSTVRNVDQIVFMDQGKVVDVDNFENLVAKQERFRKMVELQEL